MLGLDSTYPSVRSFELTQHLHVAGAVQPVGRLGANGLGNAVAALPSAKGRRGNAGELRHDLDAIASGVVLHEERVYRMRTLSTRATRVPSREHRAATARPPMRESGQR